MGQGLYTKLIQVTSTVLGIPHSRIFTSSVATDKVPNNMATAGSLSSDLYGMAVVDACSKIMKRLEPYRKDGTTWKDWVQAANNDRVSLSAIGYYATPEIGFDIKTKSGKMFSYFTCGARCSFVEVDCLTGKNFLPFFYFLLIIVHSCFDFICSDNKTRFLISEKKIPRSNIVGNILSLLQIIKLRDREMHYISIKCLHF